MKYCTNWEIIYLLTRSKKRLKPKEIMKLGYPVTVYSYAKKLNNVKEKVEKRLKG